MTAAKPDPAARTPRDVARDAREVLACAIEKLGHLCAAIVLRCHRKDTGVVEAEFRAACRDSLAAGVNALRRLDALAERPDADVAECWALLREIRRVVGLPEVA